MSDAEAWRTELQAHKRRLAILKEQAALQGFSRDPRLDLEIEDIERQAGALEQKLGLAQPAPQAPAEAARSIGPAPVSAGGDAIIANVSASSNVAVGKNISQSDRAGGASDRAAIEQGLAALSAARARLEPQLASMAEFQIALLSGELLKLDSEIPSANTIVMVGDWLLANAPPLGVPLRALLATPAAARVIARAGGAAPAWRARACDPGS